MEESAERVYPREDEVELRNGWRNQKLENSITQEVGIILKVTAQKSTRETGSSCRNQDRWKWGGVWFRKNFLSPHQYRESQKGL